MGTASNRRRSSRLAGAWGGRRRGRSGLYLLVVLACLPLLLYLASPILGLIVRTKFSSYMCCRTALAPLRISLMTASISLVIAVVIGTPVAYWLSHYRFRGKDIIDTLIDLPLVLPPVAGGLALLLLFGMQGLGAWLDKYHLRLALTLPAVVMAQVFVASPFYVKQARAGFEAVPRELRSASATLGASALRTFFKVTAPLARPALIAGAVMTWARALGEFGATLMFAGGFPGRTETMPVAIYTMAASATPEALRSSVALAVFLVAVSFIVLIAARRLVGRALTFSASQ